MSRGRPAHLFRARRHKLQGQLNSLPEVSERPFGAHNLWAKHTWAVLLSKTHAYSCAPAASCGQGEAHSFIFMNKRAGGGRGERKPARESLASAGRRVGTIEGHRHADTIGGVTLRRGQSGRRWGQARRVHVERRRGPLMALTCNLERHKARDESGSSGRCCCCSPPATVIRSPQGITLAVALEQTQSSERDSQVSCTKLRSLYRLMASSTCTVVICFC